MSNWFFILMGCNINKQGHTPGPWHLESHPEETTQLIGQGDIRVADIWATDLPDGEANARLIAAAPDLLAALEETVAMLEDFWRAAGSPVHAAEISICEARAAIAKAKGE